MTIQQLSLKKCVTGSDWGMLLWRAFGMYGESCTVEYDDFYESAMTSHLLLCLKYNFKRLTCFIRSCLTIEGQCLGLVYKYVQ